MPLNNCTEFTAIDGGGSSELDNRIYYLFSELDALNDNESLVLSEFSFNAKEKAVNVYGQPALITSINLVISGNHKTYHYDISHQDISCFCELLLFIVVNFGITTHVEQAVISAMTLFKEHLVYYRYSEEMDRLFLHLSKKPGSKAIIQFLYNAWYEYYPDWKLSFVL